MRSAEFGTDVEKNASHGSDAPETARLESTHFDEDALGWPWEPVASLDAVPAAERWLVYDTTE